jgi:predicted GH43/DUF377 family glycosyl hydrolase
MLDLEKSYQESMAAAFPRAAKMGKAELVLGIPFLFDKAEKGQMLVALQRGLSTFFPGLKAVIICFMAEEPFSSENKKDYSELGENILVFSYNNTKLFKKGWAIRGIMDLASAFDADLLLLEPALFAPVAEKGAAGLTLDWIEQFYHPIQDGYADLVLPRFNVSFLENSIADHLVFPLLGALYNLELRACLGSGLALDRNLLSLYVDDVGKWPEEAFEFGIDTWLLVHALEQGAEIAEVHLGQKPIVDLPIDLYYYFVQTVQVLFKAIGKKPSQQSWRKKPAALRSPLVFGARESYYLQSLLPHYLSFLANFRRGLTRFHRAVWSRIFPEELTNHLQELASLSKDDFYFPEILWVQLVYDSLLAYNFVPGLRKEDIAASLWSLFEGRLAGFLNEISMAGPCKQIDTSTGENYCLTFARRRVDAQMDTFIARKRYLMERWSQRKEALQPFLPEIAYWEYIPGIPIILPLRLESPEGNIEHVSVIYEQLLQECKVQFDHFTVNNLGLSIKDGSFKIAFEMCQLLQKLEKQLDELLLPGDTYTPNGMHTFVDQVFQYFPAAHSFSIKSEVAEQFLREHPPRNLITIYGCRNIDELFQRHDALDVLALINWSEDIRYATLINEKFRDNLQPHHFENSPVKPLIVDHRDFPALASIKEAPMLSHLASRVVVSNLRCGSGGNFPKIRLFTTILKSILDARELGEIWEYFTRNRKEFANMVMNSIEHHWGSDTFSAHTLFENRQHRFLQEWLQDFAEQCRYSGKEDLADAGELLKKTVEGYHLGMTLPDGYFITTSLWSWASYNFKGGKNFPTPLSLMVERRWFDSELFYRCCEKVGVSREEVFQKIVELMSQGREAEDLAIYYLGAPKNGKEVILKQKLSHKQPLAGQLQRSVFNPLLVPLKENDWESRYVLNCGTIRVDGNIYIFYRAVGEDCISRLGLAISKDGLRVDKRLPLPVFSPGHESEKMGCEDPRLILIEGRIYMLYTAYDGVLPQIALASIDPDDLVNFRWQHWHRHGLVFPDFPNKDAIFFPERFNGKLAMYHRINPNIWLTYSDSFDTPWPKENHCIVMGTRSGMMWDAVKIGAGAQPIKTKYGWLLIYHGVDYCLCYRLGIFLTSLQSPSEIIYRSPNPILGPETSYEVGVCGHCWVPNVVFTCGALPAADKEVLDDDNDEILVYYGGADTVIGVASITLGELIPEEFRKKIVGSGELLV